MAESHHSYQIPSKSSDATPQTAEERQAIHDAARQPGRVRFDAATGQYTVEQPQRSEPATPQVDTSNWWSHATEVGTGKPIDVFAPGVNFSKVEIPDGHGGTTNMEAALLARLIHKDGSGKWLAHGPAVNPTRPESPAGEKAQDDQKQDNKADEAVRWESPVVDQIVGTLAPHLGPDTMQGLVSHAVVTGEGELTDAQAESLASKIESWTPAQAKLAYATAYAEAVEAAAGIVQRAGVQDEAAFYQYMETNHSGALRDIRYAFAAGDAAPLVRAAKQYVETRGGGVDPATVERLLDPKNVITGGKLYRNEKGIAMVQIDGRDMTLAQAVANGFVKVSNNG